MGAQISTNKLQTSQKINDILLKLSITGPLQSNVANKRIAIEIDGFLMENDAEVKTPSAEDIKTFTDFVSTQDFKGYLENSLFTRKVENVPGFTYEIPPHTLKNLKWTVDSTPILLYSSKGGHLEYFKVKFFLLMSDHEGLEHKLSRAVAFVGKGLVSALQQKRAEIVPPLKTKGFAPSHISFTI